MCRSYDAKLNLLELGAYFGNVSEACRTQAYSIPTGTVSKMS
jgi:hypothetical protein